MRYWADLKVLNDGNSTATLQGQEEFFLTANSQIKTEFDAKYVVFKITNWEEDEEIDGDDWLENCVILPK